MTSKKTGYLLGALAGVGVATAALAGANLSEQPRAEPTSQRGLLMKTSMAPIFAPPPGAPLSFADIVDAVVEITETGRALRAAGLRIVETLLVSFTELIANPLAVADPNKRHAMHQIRTLLTGVLDARDKVMLKLNVGATSLDAVIALLPSMKAPTVSQLFGGDGFALETVVARSEVNLLIPALKDAGASDIVELPISKIVA